jgi:hypothetical protein
VVAYLNTGTLTAITNFVGAVLRPLRSLLSSLVNCVQQPTSGLSYRFKSFAVSLFHVPTKAWSSKREAQRITVNGAKSYE